MRLNSSGQRRKTRIVWRICCFAAGSDDQVYNTGAVAILAKAGTVSSLILDLKQDHQYSAASRCIVHRFEAGVYYGRIDISERPPIRKASVATEILPSHIINGAWDEGACKSDSALL
jgi:hypothetical protein